MMTHRQRLLNAVRGDMPDHIPYAPRIDLWFNANSLNGTLPQRHQGKTRDQIALSEGWALHKVVADHLHQPNPDAMLHRALGVHFMKEYVAHFTFSDRVKIEIKRAGDRTRIRYTTAKGSITTSTVYSQEMRRSGTSVPWIEEHAVKAPDDLRVLADVFENMDVVANYEAFKAHQAEVGENGLPVTAFTVAAGPVHHIQKYFLDATEFFHYYRDHQPEILYLADVLAPLYEKALRIVAESPAEVIQWGSNFDDMLTFPPMFAQHFVPWIRKAKEVLGPKNIRILCHTDGENLGLMDLLHESGMDVAEAVCPAPMTKVSIQEYYRRWSDRITIFGGVPSNLLLPQLTPDEEFPELHGRAFLRHRHRRPGSFWVLRTPPRRMPISNAWSASATWCGRKAACRCRPAPSTRLTRRRSPRYSLKRNLRRRPRRTPGSRKSGRRS